MHASNTSPWTLVARSLVEPCGDGALRTTLHSAVVRALDYLSESESSRTSSLGPGKLRPSSRREQRTGGALQTLEVEGRAAATALRSKAWNATLGALSASRSSSSAAFPASSGTVTPPGSPRTSSSASGPPSLCSRAPIAEALVLTHLVLVEMECVEHVLADCLIEVDAALSAWQKQHGSGPIEHVLETLSEAPTELQTPTPSTPAGDAIVKLGSIWNQKVRLLGRLERYAQQLRYVWRQVVRRCLWDSAHGSPRMEEDEYLGRIAATVLREHFAASPAERGADGTDARADAAATASDAQCVAGLLEMLFDAMIVVEDVLGLSNSIKLLEETNVQLEGVEVASQAGGGAGGAGARGSRRGKKEQLGKTYGQIAHHRACVESQLATGGAQEPPRRLPRSLQGVVVVPSRGSTSKSGGGAGGVNKRAPFSLLSADLTPSAWTVAAKVKVALLAAGALLGGVALVKHRGKVLGTVSAVGAFFASHVIEPIKVIVQEVFEHQRGKSITDEVAIVDAKLSMRNMLDSYYVAAHPDVDADSRFAKVSAIDMVDVSRDYEREIQKPVVSMNPRAETMVTGNAPQLLLMQVQYMKMQLLEAMQAMDHLRLQNIFNMQLMALFPTCVVTALAAMATVRAARSGWILSSTRTSRGIADLCKRRIALVDRHIQAQPITLSLLPLRSLSSTASCATTEPATAVASLDDEDNEVWIGELFVHLHELRELIEQVQMHPLVSDIEQHALALGDCEDIMKLSSSVEMKERAVRRLHRDSPEGSDFLLI